MTHDISEALKLETKVLVMDGGEIQQYASPDELLRHPATDFVRRLVDQQRRCMPWLRMKRTGRKENESVRVGTAISLLYDALGYAAQVSEIADGHVKDGEDFSRDQLRELWEKALN